ncbi:MAG: TolC family protein [Gemmatimonadales bacterium]
MRTDLMLLLLAATPAAAQAPPLTLREARERARATSPELAAAQASARAARLDARQAGAPPNPVLAIGRERTRGAGGVNAQTTLQLEQRLDFAGRPAAAAAAAARAGAAEARVARTADLLDARVSRLYARLAAAGRRVVLADRLRALADSAATRTARRVDAGDAAGYDRRRLDLEAARLAGVAIQERFEADSLTGELAALIGGTPSELRLADTAFTPGELPVLDSLLVWMATRPDLRAAGHLVEAARSEAAARSRSRIPVPTIAAGYKTERTAGSADRQDGFIAGLALPLPFWDRRSAATAAGSALVEAAEADLRAARRDAEVEVRRLHRALATALEQHRLFAGRLGPEADRALVAINAGFIEGEVTAAQWLDAVRAWRDAQATLLLLDAAIVDRQAELAAAAGITFERLGGTTR